MNEILDRLRERIAAIPYPDPHYHGHGEARDLDDIARAARELLRVSEVNSVIPRTVVILEARTIAEAVVRMIERRGA